MSGRLLNEGYYSGDGFINAPGYEHLAGVPLEEEEPKRNYAREIATILALIVMIVMVLTVTPLVKAQDELGMEASTRVPAVINKNIPSDDDTSWYTVSADGTIHITLKDSDSGRSMWRYSISNEDVLVPETFDKEEIRMEPDGQVIGSILKASFVPASQGESLLILHYADTVGTQNQVKKIINVRVGEDMKVEISTPVQSSYKKAGL